MTVLSDQRRRVLVPAPSRALALFPLAAFAVDVVALVVATAVAIIGRARLPIFTTVDDVASTLVMAAPLMMLGWAILLWLRGSYHPSVFGAGMDEYKRVITASLLAAGVVGIGCYLLRYQLSRGFFVLAMALGIPLLVLGRYLLRRFLHAARQRGSMTYRVLISGSPSHVDEIAAVLRRESWLGYHVIGALVPPEFAHDETPSGVTVLGSTDEASTAVRSSAVDILFFAGGAGSSKQMRRTIWALEDDHVQVVVAPNVTDVSSERVRVRPVGGLPLVHLDPPRATQATRWAKRAFDIVGSLVLLLMFAPVLAVAAVRIKSFDGGPVLFRQARIGRNGAEFACLKLRTMVVDAESRLAELHESEGYAGGLFKMKDDPRITRPGAWLRRRSLDELPQLVNVLRGDMSLVGPRPPLPSEVASYAGDTERRLRVRPGMTGLWQVSGRSDLSWEEAIRLDLYYVDNWSMLQDLTILARTFSTVMFPKGAY